MQALMSGEGNVCESPPAEGTGRWALRELGELERLLCCPICCGFMNNAVVFRECAHVYCAVCVHRALMFKEECPTCRNMCDSTDLSAIRYVDELVARFRTVRPHLWRKFGTGGFGEDVLGIESDDVVVLEKEDVSDKRDAEIAAESSSKGKQSRTGGRVACPVCGLSVLAAMINTHLDECIGKDETRKVFHERRGVEDSTGASTSEICSFQKVPRLPKLAYKLMSERQLREVLAKYGLPTHGSKSALSRLHSEFVVQYNAWAGTNQTPLRMEEFVKRFKKRNAVLLAAAAKSSAVTGKRRRAATKDTNASAGAALVPGERSRQTHFESLITQIRRREPGRPGPPDESVGRKREHKVEVADEDGSSSGDELKGSQPVYGTLVASTVSELNEGSGRPGAALDGPERVGVRKVVQSRLVAPAIAGNWVGDGRLDQRDRLASGASRTSWRCVFSERLQLPFYFNEATRIGQFEPPPFVRNRQLVSLYSNSRFRDRSKRPRTGENSDGIAQHSLRGPPD